MKKEINLKIKDYRQNFNEPHKKKPYYLFIEYGENKFVFSNKEKAKRFLTKFKKESTFLFKELGFFISNLYQINIQLASNLSHLQFLKNNDELNYSSIRYSKILSNYFNREPVIGSEINMIYYEINSQYIFYNKFLSKNNRSNILLLDIKSKMKMLSRLKKDFELLLTNSDGINNVTNIDYTELKYQNILTIA